jgi:hypothetical protein
MVPDFLDSQAVSAPAPSAKLLRAALTGILAMSVNACAGSDNDGALKITSSQQVENLDADGFTAMCDAREGTVESLAHCGGLASARGFSYDTTTGALSEHTCKGANTCAGWNCVTDK